MFLQTYTGMTVSFWFSSLLYLFPIFPCFPIILTYNWFLNSFFPLFIPFISLLVLPSGYFYSPLCFCLQSYTDINVQRCVYFTDHQYFFLVFHLLQVFPLYFPSLV
jgi:hypothetical protein